MRILTLLIPAVVALQACHDRDQDLDSHETSSFDSLSVALLDLEQRIVADPSNPVLYAERAALYLMHDSARSAANDLQRAIALDSTNAQYHLRLGEVYYLNLQVDLAMGEFGKAMALDPADTESRLKTAEIWLVLRQYQSAMDLTNEALRIDPNTAHGYYIKGWIYKELSDTNLAISSFRTAVEQDPQDYDAYIQLGLLHAAQRDPLAIEYYNTASDLRPMSIEALYNKGMFCQENGRDSMALEAYARILEIDPRNAAALYNSGWVRMEHLGDLQQARRDLERAFSFEPRYYQAIYNRGVVFERTGQLDSAAMDYKAALALKPDFDLAAEGLDRLVSRGVRVDRP